MSATERDGARRSATERDGARRSATERAARSAERAVIPPPGRFKHHRSQDRLTYCAAFSNLGVGVSTPSPPACRRRASRSFSARGSRPARRDTPRAGGRIRPKPRLAGEVIDEILLLVLDQQCCIQLSLSLSKSDYVIIWSRRSLIPYVKVIFANREAVALAPNPSVLAGSGAAIGGAPVAGSVGAKPLSGCGE